MKGKGRRSCPFISAHSEMHRKHIAYKRGEGINVIHIHWKEFKFMKCSKTNRKHRLLMVEVGVADPQTARLMIVESVNFRQGSRVI